MLPPLQPTPHLARLITPGEEIIYTAKLHPGYGWPWLAGALACAAGTYVTLWAALPALLLALIYGVAFKNWECAITNRRLLLRYGRFGTTLNDIAPSHINHYQMRQGLFGTLCNYGHLTLHLTTTKDLRALPLPYLAHPYTFIEALETLTTA